MNKPKQLSSSEQDNLLATLQTRFEQNMHRHPNLSWSQVKTRLEANQDKLWSLSEMEKTGGEPDVLTDDKNAVAYTFYDCSPESPRGRRSLCFDQAAWDKRKANKPKSNVTTMAETMGIELLTEAQYRRLQNFGEFDTKTSSWIQTPPEIRKLGGALFCDRRYGQVFTYHNGADSYYGARGFRGVLRI